MGKRRNRRKKSRLPLTIRVFILFWVLGSGVYVANEYYTLRILWEQIFPVHYKSYTQFGIKIPTQFTVHGIDVSHHQGPINWKMVSDMRDNELKLDFVFIKATEGITHKDSRFDYNWKNSKRNKMIRGAYHYYKPNAKGEEQANHFIRNVKLVQGDFPPVIDVEENGNVSSKRLMEGLMKCALKLEKEYGVKPIIYTYHDFYKQNFDASFNDYPLWIAHYYVKKPNTKQWDFWQHNDRGRVSGINHPVDFNVHQGSLEELQLLLIK